MIRRIGGLVRTALFGIAPDQTSFAARGFAGTAPDKQARLEGAGRAFVHGYRAALRSADVAGAAAACQRVTPFERGFAYEGAGMGCALRDLVTRGTPTLFRGFVAGAAGPHIYMAHVGAGWALARCPWGWVTFLRHLDPLLTGLVMDGLGFHEGFFRPDRAFARRHGHWTRRADPEAFDSGLGRALWFVSGARPESVASTIAAFPAERRAALWSGIGLAATYTGCASPADLQLLIAASRPWRTDVALGASFAAKARARAGNAAEESARACRAFCEMDASSAAAVTDNCLRSVPLPHGRVSYAKWKALIRTEFAQALTASTAGASCPG